MIKIKGQKQQESLDPYEFSYSCCGSYFGFFHRSVRRYGGWQFSNVVRVKTRNITTSNGIYNTHTRTQTQVDRKMEQSVIGNERTFLFFLFFFFVSLLESKIHLRDLIIIPVQIRNRICNAFLYLSSLFLFILSC